MLIVAILSINKITIVHRIITRQHRNIDGLKFKFGTRLCTFCKLGQTIGYFQDIANLVHDFYLLNIFKVSYQQIITVLRSYDSSVRFTFHKTESSEKCVAYYINKHTPTLCTLKVITMAINDFRVAVVCWSNMNRSMEAHSFLSKKGFNVQSFGTGDMVRLPGATPNKPNSYAFGCCYDDIYNDLYYKDRIFYTQNGLLHMLDRNRRIKPRPQRFQDCTEQFTVIITCEEKVYDQVLGHFESLLSFGNKPVYVINMDIKDNHEEATIGAFSICELVNLLSKSEDLDNDFDKLIAKYEEKCQKPLLISILFY